MFGESLTLGIGYTVLLLSDFLYTVCIFSTELILALFLAIVLHINTEWECPTSEQFIFMITLGSMYYMVLYMYDIHCRRASLFVMIFDVLFVLYECLVEE